jgi:hypothetical protein
MIANILADPTVHTSGINWQAIGVIVTPIILILGGFFKYVMSSNQRKNRDDVEAVIREQVTPELHSLIKRFDGLEAIVNNHGQQLAHLQGVEQGRQMAVQQQANARRASDPDS